MIEQEDSATTSPHLEEKPLSGDEICKLLLLFNPDC
jgi:hypothetical protein